MTDNNSASASRESGGRRDSVTLDRISTVMLVRGSDTRLLLIQHAAWMHAAHRESLRWAIKYHGASGDIDPSLGVIRVWANRGRRASQVLRDLGAIRVVDRNLGDHWQIVNTAVIA
jgi:hypothetical protein